MRYHLGYFDDTDYCKRAQALGFRTARSKGSYVYHKENTTFRNLSDNNKLFKDNERIFFERWGRPVRVGYILDGSSASSSVDEIAISVARSGHQILFLMNRSSKWPVSIDHYDIRRIYIPRIFFSIISLYKIIKRKKKKKMDVIITDNDLMHKILNLSRPLHEAEVLMKPSLETLNSAINKISKS